MKSPVTLIIPQKAKNTTQSLIAMAYTVTISPNNSSANQSSPGWMLTFMRWRNRDTFRYSNPTVGEGQDPDLRSPLVVINDCIHLTVTTSKSSVNSNFQAVLVGTDLNYSTAIAPGDFCFINMLRYDTDTVDLHNRALGLNPINGYEDGFKGLFKIQSVRRNLSISPEGIKHLVYTVTGHAFTELNNVIYFSPYLATEADKQRPLNLFVANLGNEWRNTSIGEKDQLCHDMIGIFLKAMLGSGVSSDKNETKVGLMKTENRHFELPKNVGNLLGIEATHADDMYRFVAGIQEYTIANNKFKSIGTEEKPDHSNGLFPSNQVGQRNYIGDGKSVPLKDKCEGTCLTTPDLWNQNQAWSIMKQLANTEINELFTCHRLFPNGLILPTIIYRQIPFTTEYYAPQNEDKGKVTRFLSLPRWKVDPELILSFDIGRDEGARFNMIQLFGSTSLVSGQAGINNQIAAGNFVVDAEDITRHGLKPLITSTQFDLVKGDVKEAFNSPRWARYRADWLIGGQLKESGHITMIGIQEPICEGDNFQLGDYVFHIEGIEHSCSVASNGLKQFRTTLSLSNGISVKSSSSQVVYDEMEHTDAHTTKRQDSKGLDVYPGIGDLQDVPGRVSGEETKETEESSFTLSMKARP